MSKKQKKIKKVASTVSERPSEIKPASVPGPVKPLARTTISLILFDKKTKLFLAVLFALYVLLSTFKIHTSNIANWDIFFGATESESVIAGKPRFIRMDEWMITSPAVMGQYEKGLPIKNEANGGGNAPVVFGLPIKDVSTFLRPSTWSYFIFDLERAFAFAWNFNLFFFSISMFLLLMLLTKNNFWVSVLGTFFIFLAPGIQWWSYTISNLMMYLNGMLISFIYLLYARRTLPLIVSALVLVTCIFSFLAFLYPPFQVPLVYLYLAILVGYLIREKRFIEIRYRLALRIVIAAASFILLGAILLHYYAIARESFDLMLNTVYPGRRFSMGGDLKQGKLFADFFGMFMSDSNFPRQWENICEISGGLMFFPIIFYALLFYYFKYRRTDSLLYTLSIFIIFTLAYVLVGFPAFLSKLSLLSMSPAFRTLPIVGVANCILLVCFIGSKNLEVKKPQFSWIEFGVLAVLILIFVRMVSSHINRATENFFTPSQVNIVSFLILSAYLLIRFKDHRFVKPALSITLLILSISAISVNPLTKGLSAVTANPLVQASREIHKKDPEAGWTLYGNIRYTHLLKANGINIFNSVKYVPPLDQLKILDPRGQFDTIYNRYAWMTMGTYINWKDTIIFKKTFTDAYTIFMDPCSPKLKQLNVKYFVFDYAPKEAEVRCMTKLTEAGKFFIYKRNDP